MARPARPVSRLPLILGLIGCGLWATVVGVVSAVTWGDTLRGIAKERQDGRTFCGERYADPDAHERCVDLFDVQYVNERNGAIATRVIVASLPFAGLGVWFWIARSRRPAIRSISSANRPPRQIDDDQT